MASYKKILSAVTLSAALAFTAVASAAPISAVANDNAAADTTYHTVNVAQLHPAQKLVKDGYENMIIALKRDKAEIQRNPGHIYDLLEANILMNFDFRRTSRLVLARHWRKATDAQRDRFTEEFSKMLTRTYAKYIVSFSDQTVTFKPFRASAFPDRAQVRSTIINTSGPNVDVDYSLYLNNKNEWKIYNITVEGFNMALTYRSEYSSAIRRLGGIDALIDKLAEKNRNASPPSPGA